jgi:hypothetical protein
MELRTKVGRHGTVTRTHIFVKEFPVLFRKKPQFLA